MNTIKIKKTNIRNLRIITVILILLLLSNVISTAQINDYKPRYYEVGYSAFLSGNGLGGFYSFYGNINTGKSIFSFGPCIQKKSQQTRAVKFSYSYKFFDNDACSRLRLYSYLFYADQLPLSTWSIENEEMQAKSLGHMETNKEKKNWNEVRLSTLETGFGAELGLRLMEGIELRNFIGLSVFYHTKYEEGMFADRIAPVLMVGTSINFYNRN